MIGLWIARLTDRASRLTLWHLVQSEIQDRMVTKCGRQMGDIKGTVLAPLMSPPSRNVACYWCKA